MKKTPRRPKSSDKAKPPLATPRWRKLPKGVWKTDLGPGLPEVVIFTMANEEFGEFRACSDRAKIRNLNKRRILKRNLIDVVLQKPKPRKPGKCILMQIYHTPESTGYMVPHPVG